MLACGKERHMKAFWFWGCDRLVPQFHAPSLRPLIKVYPLIFAWRNVAMHFKWPDSPSIITPSGLSHAPDNVRADEGGRWGKNYPSSASSGGFSLCNTINPGHHLCMCRTNSLISHKVGLHQSFEGHIYQRTAKSNMSFLLKACIMSKYVCQHWGLCGRYLYCIIHSTDHFMV